MPAFAALRVPAYRRLLLAITVMEIGLFAFETALYWTVLDETGSAARVSLLFTGLVVPALLLTIPVGVLVDRIGPKGILVWGSAAAAAVMGLAAFAAGSGRLGFELALLLAIAEGVFFGCYAVPAQVIAGRVVDRSLIASAVGMSALPAGIRASGRARPVRRYSRMNRSKRASSTKPSRSYIGRPITDAVSVAAG